MSVFSYIKEKHGRYTREFNPQNALFVFNKWDLVPMDEKMKLEEEAIKTINGM